MSRRRKQGRIFSRTEFTKSRERGRFEAVSRSARREGPIMSLVTREVVTVPPTMSIKGAAEAMTKYRFRRLPVADPGTKRLLGIIGSSDIIDFLGGGEKFHIIAKKHGGNFLSAVNDSVSEIMERDVLALRENSTIKEALELIVSTRVGGLVVVDKENRVSGIVTESDFVSLLSEKFTGKRAESYMTKKVVTASPGMRLGDASKAMVRNSFRRLPVVSEGKLVGMVTTRAIIEFVGRNNVFDRVVGNRVDEVLKTHCKEIMKTNVATVSRDADLGEVAEVMDESGLGTVCVVEDGRLAGILTERDVVLALGK